MAHRTAPAAAPQRHRSGTAAAPQRQRHRTGTAPAPPGRHRPPPSTVAIDEQDVAFFGAVDSRRYLFLLAVTLQSVARFHHHAGFFVLAPPGSNGAWSPLLQQWTNGTAELVELQDDTAQFERPQGGGYSAMTFHRLRMPQLLASLGSGSIISSLQSSLGVPMHCSTLYSLVLEVVMMTFLLPFTLLYMF